MPTHLSRVPKHISRAKQHHGQQVHRQINIQRSEKSADEIEETVADTTWVVVEIRRARNERLVWQSECPAWMAFVCECLYLSVCTWVFVLECLYLSVCTWVFVLECLYLSICTWVFVLECLYLSICTWVFVLEYLYLSVCTGVFVLECLYLSICTWVFVLECLYLSICTWVFVLEYLYLSVCTWVFVLECLYLSICTWVFVLEYLYLRVFTWGVKTQVHTWLWSVSLLQSLVTGATHAINPLVILAVESLRFMQKWVLQWNTSAYTNRINEAWEKSLAYFSVCTWDVCTWGVCTWDVCTWGVCTWDICSWVFVFECHTISNAFVKESTLTNTNHDGHLTQAEYNNRRMRYAWNLIALSGQSDDFINGSHEDVQSERCPAFWVVYTAQTNTQVQTFKYKLSSTHIQLPMLKYKHSVPSNIASDESHAAIV